MCFYACHLMELPSCALLKRGYCSTTLWQPSHQPVGNLQWRMFRERRAKRQRAIKGRVTFAIRRRVATTVLSDGFSDTEYRGSTLEVLPWTWGLVSCVC